MMHLFFRESNQTKQTSTVVFPSPSLARIISPSPIVFLPKSIALILTKSSLGPLNRGSETTTNRMIFSHDKIIDPLLPPQGGCFLLFPLHHIKTAISSSGPTSPRNSPIPTLLCPSTPSSPPSSGLTSPRCCPIPTPLFPSTPLSPHPSASLRSFPSLSSHIRPTSPTETIIFQSWNYQKSCLS